MALSRFETYPGIHFPTREGTKPASSLLPLSLTPSEIDRIMLTIPPELTVENPVRTPVGTWIMEDRPTFHCVSAQRLAEIRIPERKDRVINKIKVISRMY